MIKEIRFFGKIGFLACDDFSMILRWATKTPYPPYKAKYQKPVETIQTPEVILMITQVASILESKIYLGLVFFELIPKINY
ncbi:MAG: hypothetical protein ABFS56_35715 [Pseudomonadota bacterium]